MDELDFSKIKEMVRDENDSLFEKIKIWSIDHLVTKEGYLKDQLTWNTEIVQPIKTRINALWVSLGMTGVLASILAFFFR